MEARPGAPLLLLFSALLSSPAGAQINIECKDTAKCLCAGWYILAGKCSYCPIGSKCPEPPERNISMAIPCPIGTFQVRAVCTCPCKSIAIPCPIGTFQDMMNRASCQECSIGYFQNLTGRPNCTRCADGWTTTSVGMSTCDTCIPVDYYRSGTRCLSRGAKCNPATQYEDPASANSTRVCKTLTACDTAFKGAPESVTIGAASTAVKIIPRNEYIIRYPTATSDRVCRKWSVMKCLANRYALQLPVDDDNGFLIKPLICKPYRTCLSGLEYLKVDGTVTGDRDNVCVRYTDCTRTPGYFTFQDGIIFFVTPHKKVTICNGFF